MRAPTPWIRLSVVAAMISSFAACRCDRPGTSGARVAFDGAALEVDAGTPAAVLLLNDESIDQAQWTADGAVIALSHRRFWWFRADGGGRAQTTVFNLDDGFPHFAAARTKDVTVVTAGGKAHVFRGPVEIASFAVEKQNAKALSDDGTLLVTEWMESSSATGTRSRWRLYDVATGKQLSEHKAVPILSPNGEWTTASESVREARTGEVIVKLPSFVHFDTSQSPWFDGGAMGWAESGLVVADPKARSVVTAPARCKDGEIDELIEIVDPVTKQAVRFCGSRVLVVRVGSAGSAPTVVEVPIPASRKGMKPSLGFARDDGAPLLVWGFPVGAEVDRIDVGGRSLVRAAKGSERTTARTTDAEGLPSPDGRYRLRVESILSRTGAVMVDDAAGKEIVRFGVTSSPKSIGAIAPFVYEHGVDVIVGDGAKRRRLRVGPDAAPLEDIPRLYPDGPCGGKGSPSIPDAPPQRTLTGGAAIFAWPMGGSCVCVRGGCTDPKLPPGVLARRDDQLLVSEPGQTQVTYLEQREERGVLTLQAWLRGATFLDDGASAVLLSEHRTPKDDTWRVRVTEVKLPSFEVRSEPVEIEHPPFGGWDYTVSGTKGSIAVFLSDRYVLKGWFMPRGPHDGGTVRLTRLEAWDESAVVTLPDGRMELYGPAAEGAIVCADGLGAVTPFATCRARFEAKGTFRID